MVCRKPFEDRLEWSIWEAGAGWAGGWESRWKALVRRGWTEGRFAIVAS